MTGANSNNFVGNVVIADIACALMDGGHGQFVECMVLVVSSNQQIIHVQAPKLSFENMHVSVGSILHRITPRALHKILLKGSLLIKGSIYHLFIIHQQKGIRGTKAPAGMHYM